MIRPADFKLVVLDRDGTINRDSPQYVKNADEWDALPGALEAIAQLSQAGWTVCVATNQSGIGRGLFTIVDLHGMHDKMRRQVEVLGGHISSVCFCPHRPEDNCACRKPEPGLLEEISTRYKVSMQGVPVIGDSSRDLQSAEAVGARPILVRTGNGNKTLETEYKDCAIEVYDNLGAAAAALIAED